MLAVTTIHVERRVFEVKKVTRISLTKKSRFTNLVFISMLAAYLNMFLTLSIFFFFSSNKSVADFPSKLQVSVRKLGFWEMKKKPNKYRMFAVYTSFLVVKTTQQKAISRNWLPFI